MYAFTLNRVQMRKDGEPVVVPANTVKDMDDTTFGKLKKLGAVRAATEDEITIFKSGNPGSTDVPLVDNDDTTNTGSETAADSTPPPSGAKGDPASGQAAKGAKSSKPSSKTSGDDEDI